MVFSKSHSIVVPVDVKL